MQHVVGPVDGDPVRAALVGAEDRAVEEQGEVDHAAADQIVPRPLVRAGEGKARDAEEQVDDVVQDADVEDAEQLRIGAVPGELQIVVVRRDPRDEAQDPDQQEDRADEHCDGLDR